MSAHSSPPTQHLLLVTGMLGAGKSNALRTLEDLGWETIDNFPLELLEQLLDGHKDEWATPIAVGIDSRTRGFAPDKLTELTARLTARPELAVTTMFLDCADHELERRYNETRRRHPLANKRPASEGIAAERKFLVPLIGWADIVIDTSQYTANHP